jgi:hypothetical protein
MVGHGVLLLTFSLILLAIKEVNQNPVSLMPPSIPPPPAFFCCLAKVLLILIAAFVLFWIWWKHKLARFIKRWPKVPVKPIVYLVTLVLLLFILWLIPPIPTMHVWVFKGLGIVTFLASLVFMVAIFYQRWADKLHNYLKDQQYTYWVIFWVVYTVSWLKGLISIPPETFIFKMVFYVGFVWFLVIGFVMLRTSWHDRR